MRMADGSELRILGTINLPLYIDNQVIHQLMLVADVEIPVVLVFDNMNKNKYCVELSWLNRYLTGNIMVSGKYQR
jgi:hypothetical protein